MLLDLTAAYIQVPIKVTTYNPIIKFPDVFSERIPDELPLLREPNMHYRIKLIDLEKNYQSSSYPYCRKILFTI